MNRLKECRENMRLSQKYIAITLGVKPPSVSNWERGTTNPTQENMIKLADLYGVSVDYLMGRTDNPNDDKGEEAKTEQDGTPRTPEARILSAGIDKMPARDRERALQMVRIMFDKYADYFKEGTDDDDT